MFNRTNSNLSQIVFIVFFYISSYHIIDGVTSFKLDSKNTSLKSKLKSCIPCNISKYQTLKSLEHQFVMDKNLKHKELECWHGGLKSMLMNYNEYELDLDISIINPYQNKNEGCSFQVYWKGMLQTTIQLNQDGQAQSSNSTWHLYPNTKTKFWLVKDSPNLDPKILNGKLYLFCSGLFW